MNLTKDQSYDTTELQALLPEDYAVSGYGESRLTIHGDMTPEAQTIVNTHINAMTLDERRLENMRKDKIKESHNKCEEALSIITSNYSEGEMKTWTIQELEARQYAADNTILTPFIDTIAQGRGISKVDMVNRIIQKSDVFHLYSAQQIAKRQAMEVNSLAAIDIDELKAVVF